MGFVGCEVIGSLDSAKASARFSYTVLMSSEFSLEHLDVLALARSGVTVGFEVSNAVDRASMSRLFSRLLDEACEPDGLGDISWKARAELRLASNGESQPWLFLEAEASLRLICQRCLRPANVSVTVERWFRFVSDEATAEQEDDESEEDVLALPARFNLVNLVEDELLMAVPMVPMHDVCIFELPTTAGEEDFHAVMEARQSPFAALSQLKKPS